MTESITPNLEIPEFYLQFNEILPPLEIEGQFRPTTYVFFTQLDAVLQPICAEIEQEIYKKVPGKPGKYPFSVKAMLKAHLYAKFMRSMPYRALQREMQRNDDLRIAFGFKKVPSHQAMSDFRKRVGANRLNKIFTHVVQAAIQMHLTDVNETLIDSAPIEAYVNFGKANKTPTFDFAELQQFFQFLNLKALLKNYHFKTRSHTSFEALISFYSFEELGGFLSFNSVWTYVKKSKDLQTFFQFGPKFPVYATLKNIKAKLEKEKEYSRLMEEITKLTAHYFKKEEELQNFDSPSLKYFFGILRKNYSSVDTEARIGYCASKEKYYLGYKVHLILSKKIIAQSP